MRLAKDDQVIVVTGKDAGKKGRIIKVFPTENKVLVEKINYQTVYLRRSQQNPNGGVTKAEGKIHASNVRLVDPRSGKATGIGYKKLADGTKHRVAKKSGEILGE